MNVHDIVVNPRIYTLRRAAVLIARGFTSASVTTLACAPMGNRLPLPPVPEPLTCKGYRFMCTRMHMHTYAGTFHAHTKHSTLY